MTKRIRLVEVSIQPQLVVDDGDTLARLPIDSIVIGADQWPNVVHLFAEALTNLQKQLDNQETP
jgi:hypothetical protein